MEHVSSLSLSIVVPTFGRTHLIEGVLLTIRSDVGEREDVEVLVVDNHPAGTAKQAVEGAVAAGFRNLRYLAENRPGLHHARHTGALAARSELIAYLDDDVLVVPGWVDGVLRGFRESPTAGCVGGKVLPEWEADAPAWVSRFHPGYLSLLDLGEQRLVLKFPEGVYGCNMAVRRQALFAVGGFNPDAFGDPSLVWRRGDGETGLQQKLFQAGYNAVYEPSAVVRHRIPATRLTIAYFKRRAFIQGISDSYTKIRNQPSRLKLVDTLVASAMSLVRARLRVLKWVREDRVEAPVQTAYWQGYWGHQLRTLLSPALFRHVTRRTYLQASAGTSTSP
jgi:GT2 family glycosyltransferase